MADEVYRLLQHRRLLQLWREEERRKVNRLFKVHTKSVEVCVCEWPDQPTFLLSLLCRETMSRRSPMRSLMLERYFFSMRLCTFLFSGSCGGEPGGVPSSETHTHTHNQSTFHTAIDTLSSIHCEHSFSHARGRGGKGRDVLTHTAECAVLIIRTTDRLVAEGRRCLRETADRQLWIHRARAPSDAPRHSRRGGR